MILDLFLKSVVKNVVTTETGSLIYKNKVLQHYGGEREGEGVYISL